MLRRLVALGTSLAIASIAVTFVVGIVEGTVLPYDRLDPTSEESIFDYHSSVMGKVGPNIWTAVYMPLLVTMAYLL